MTTTVPTKSSSTSTIVTIDTNISQKLTNGAGSTNGKVSLNGKASTTDKTSTKVKLNKVEQLKLKKNPLSLLDDIYQWADEGFEAIPPEYYDFFKWHGFFYRKQNPGTFMLRMRISNGVMNTAQLRTVATLSRDYGRGVGDLTTRQNIQLRWITIEHIPTIIETLQAVGLGSQQTGMDNFRNVTGCPLTGLTHHEQTATHQLTTATALSLLGPDFANIPRKFNISMNGCRLDCTHAKTNDIGMTPATRRMGSRDVPGFNVVVGGHMGGKTPHLAIPLDAFVRPMQAPALCRAILTVFRDNGNRAVRGKGRMWYLIDQWGIDRFRDEVMKVMGENLPSAGDCQLYTNPDPLVQDHVGVHQQIQDGLSSVGMVVPTGRIKAEQLFALSDLADLYGTREIRLTNDQNVIIPNVPNEKVAALLDEPLLQEWSPTPSGVIRGLVTCTGIDYCHFALNDTKGLSLDIAHRLEERLSDKDKMVRLNVSGCVHACGRHRASELGMEATRLRQDGKVIDGFNLFAGGSLEGATLGELTHKKATIDETVDLLASQISTIYKERVS
ncbi:MAG: ferredoxin--nitrite reductase [Chloroflexota bacterium]